MMACFGIRQFRRSETGVPPSKATGKVVFRRDRRVIYPEPFTVRELSGEGQIACARGLRKKPPRVDK